MNINEVFLKLEVRQKNHNQLIRDFKHEKIIQKKLI